MLYAELYTGESPASDANSHVLGGARYSFFFLELSDFLWGNFCSGAFRFPVEGETCIYLNSRGDRRSRTRQLVQLIYGDIKPDRSIVRGQKVETMVKHVEYHSPQTKSDILEDNDPLDSTIKLFKQLPNDSLLFAMGNQAGFGQDLIDQLMEFKSNG